ncbi:hypothetical protein HBA54_08865 [Pelagibius litoralis]|uniref:Uncharacterized protein n=1 Tax=Pelagibius litoralis TaxID=374515 RepID=A0A967C244_9PROT|nr:hypothetical protein [Pelagibius litoralis]NIA68701.1 hypothetical protein [Pelagibius litoralis]
MALPIPDALAETDRPIRRAMRRLRWFKQSFAQQVEAIAAASGTEYKIHDDRLAKAFIAWLRAFDAQKPTQSTARRDFTNFASGLMLQQLLRDAPLEVVSVPVGSDASNPAYYWPEGYVYVAYCLNVRGAVLAQDFDEVLNLAPDLSDIRTWWSFKENVTEDPSLAIAFLDLFSGQNPNWSTPSLFYERPEQLEAQQRRGIDG